MQFGDGHLNTAAIVRLCYQGQGLWTDNGERTLWKCGRSKWTRFSWIGLVALVSTSNEVSCSIEGKEFLHWLSDC
jgi:hypothetical protein